MPYLCDNDAKIGSEAIVKILFLPFSFVRIIHGMAYCCCSMNRSCLMTALLLQSTVRDLAPAKPISPIQSFRPSISLDIFRFPSSFPWISFAPLRFRLGVICSLFSLERVPSVPVRFGVHASSGQIGSDHAASQRHLQKRARIDRSPRGTHSEQQIGLSA